MTSKLVNRVVNLSWIRGFSAVVCTVGLLAPSGCSQSLPKLPTVPASGTVTYNGNPLEGAQVAFISNDKETGKPANGVTDSQGQFQLRTFLGGANQASGAMPGDYTVTVQKREESAPLDPTGENPAPAPAPVDPTKDPSKMIPEAKLLVPARYADPTKSKLTATVKPTGDNKFTFELVD